MIRYDLRCAAGHDFDGWFPGSEAFDKQVSLALVSCPTCGSTDVSKAIMAPGIASSGRRQEEATPAERMLAATGPAPELAQMIEMVRQIRRHVVENAENVGQRFAEEARRIHYEEAERRSIYGEASPDEARALAEEGIEFHALPGLPDDAN